MDQVDEYTEAWGEGAIVEPAEKTVQGAARKRAKQDQDDFEDEFANLTADKKDESQ